MKNFQILLASLLLLLSVSLTAQISKGYVQDNTNLALPESYNYREYVYAEPDDQGDCLGISNSTAAIKRVYINQTHRLPLGHPLFFMVGHRPAVLQVAVTGSGAAPDVQVQGLKGTVPIDILCLDGPDELPETIDLDQPNFEDYFSVTIPKSWITNELTIQIVAGGSSRIYSPDDLKVGPYTEMNLCMVNMDVMDFNAQEHNWPIFDNFLEELASATPASVVRFGIFPETLVFPEVIANNESETLVRLTSKSDMLPNGVYSEGSINSIAALFLENLQRSTNDFSSTVYFGNTLNLAPGGWGGGKSFVSFDFTDIFIHEFGHAFELPHWGQSAWDNPDPNMYEYLYPYGGDGNDGGGRGTTWNFIQDQYEFVSPKCQGGTSERSDCMQRNNACLETRSYGPGPWDGFSDFSALGIHRALIGVPVKTGQLEDRGEIKDFQFRFHDGWPTVSLENGKRVYTRDPVQPQEQIWEERFNVPGQANIVYRPIRMNGTYQEIIDPTDPNTFQELLGSEYEGSLNRPRDITLKLTYEDGTVRHAINPYHCYGRAPYDWTYNIWRYDLINFSMMVPADKNLAKVEVYKRPFMVSNEQDPNWGNINYAPHSITAENFMDEAVFLSEYIFGGPKVLGSNTIGNRVWHDVNQNGLIDPNEKGIPGVSLVLWQDSDGDNVPDWQGFGGVTKTDAEGYYSFGGLGPGNYLVFVWSVDNWEEGQPLHGMVHTQPFVEDPNSDINGDSNGRPGFTFGLTVKDMISGVITLTEDGTQCYHV